MVAIDERLVVNFDSYNAILDGRQLALTPIENRLLQVLYNQRGRVLSPGALLVRVWADGAQPSVQALWVHIRRLRNKIEPDPNHPRYVVTVRSRGYLLPHALTADEGDESGSSSAATE